MKIAKYNWGVILSTEIAAKIREHIELYDDYEAFSEVCSSWRLAIKEYPGEYINRKHTQLPLLMLVDPDDSSYRRFYSLTKLQFLKIHRPPAFLLSPPQARRYYSSRGWLISLTINNSKSTRARFYFNINIFKPFSNNNVTIETPLFDQLSTEQCYFKWEDCSFSYLFEKIVVSTEDDDFVVAVTFGDHTARKVAYWRRGHGDTWVVPDSLGLNNHIHNLCFFRGELYAIQYHYVEKHRVISFGDLKDHKNSPRPRVVANLKEVLANMQKGGAYDQYYLVESKYDTSSSLLFIHRCVLFESIGYDKYKTVSFNVFNLNVDNGKVENIKSLGGNQAIFVGLNSAFTVLVCANVDDDRGCKADCIYYTDDIFELHEEFMKGAGGDMGIYSLPQGKTFSFYEGPSRFSVINPPIWIEFSNA